jgi:hypothetical protein
LNIKCVVIFITIFVWNNFHSNDNWARYDKKMSSAVRLETCSTTKADKLHVPNVMYTVLWRTFKNQS